MDISFNWVFAIRDLCVARSRFSEQSRDPVTGTAIEICRCRNPLSPAKKLQERTSDHDGCCQGVSAIDVLFPRKYKWVSLPR